MENKEDIKKTQDKIIKITRITGATLFLIGIAIIAIVSVLKKQNPLPSPKEGTIISEGDTVNLIVSASTSEPYEKTISRKFSLYINLIAFINI